MIAVPVTVLVALPYGLATYIAVELFGVSNPSPTRTAIGWIAAAPSIVFMIWLAYRWLAADLEANHGRRAPDEKADDVDGTVWHAGPPVQ